MSPVPTAAAPQDRHRALAELDAEIGRAERTRARCLLDVEDTTARGGDVWPARAMLRMADERLALLRGSRRVLLPDQPPAAARSGNPGRNGGS